jgi:hypothetical protein
MPTAALWEIPCMSLDLLDEGALPLAQAARSLPSLRGGRPVDPSTLWRWSAKGLRGVRLEIVRVGGTACTSRAALRRFFAAVEAARYPTAPTPGTPAPPSGADQAAKELATFGI